MNKFPPIPLRALVLSAAVLGLESGFADEPVRLDISKEQDGKVGIHLKGGQGLHQLQRLSGLDGDWLNFGGLTSEPDWFIEPAGPFEFFRAARVPEVDLQSAAMCDKCSTMAGISFAMTPSGMRSSGAEA